MPHRRAVVTAGLALIAALSLRAPSAAAERARFEGPVYSGRPNPAAMLALVTAGGGPSDFKATTLLSVLAGPDAGACVARLVRRYDAPSVKTFILIFDFVVADALRRGRKSGIAPRASAAPDPSDGIALAGALYAAGVDPSTRAYSAHYMLDHLLSHALHVQIMNDVDAEYGRAADAIFHEALGRFIADVKAAHSV
jgi:hypothetical protein